MLKIIFAGSPEISATLLNYLLNQNSNNFEIVGIITNMPSRQGRKSELIPTPVEQAARQYDETIKVITPEKLNQEIREQISALHPDLLVCFAYGKIFGPKFMALFPKGGINIHPSLLPKYRGCAPVPAAILNREKETGVTVQRLAAEMDTGDILAQEKILLDNTENSEFLLKKAAQISCSLVVSVLQKIDLNIETSVPQNGQSSYCYMLKKEDGEIDWNKSALQIDAQIRAFYPWPGAYTYCGQNILRIHSVKISDKCYTEKPGTVVCADKKNGILVQTGNGVLAINNLQWQAKKAMEWKDFLNGSPNFSGIQLGKR